MERRRRRVILDTNLWSYIGDEGSSVPFEQLLQEHALEVLLPPSLLIEVVRLPVPGPRQRIIAAMQAGRRTRLASEAELEAREIVAEVRRCRPDWMLAMPNTGAAASLNGFWTKRVWREAAVDSQRLHDYQVRQAPVHNYLQEVQRSHRATFRQDGFKIRPLTALTASAPPGAPEGALRGWSGEPVEAWRLASRDLLWFQLRVVHGRSVLTKEDTTHTDWIGHYVSLDRARADPHGFTAFWLEQVQLAAVPRQWLRWAVPIAQTEFKITGGNPSDEQHSSYLVDADLLLTADARFVDVLSVVREDAPFIIAAPVKVSGRTSEPIVDRIAKALADLP